MFDSSANFRHGLSTKTTMFYGIALVALTLLTCVIGGSKHPSERGICGSVDIRSTTNNFNKLVDCRVVEGNVHILLLDKTTAEDFENITFPNLTEITGFFLLYRVEGLRTLSNLFPNLTVIRGRQLLYNHAFIIYELGSIQEVGLYSLTDIERGAVYISKNPNLCFAHTIDWSLIAKTGAANNVININKGDNECGVCREVDKRPNGVIENGIDDGKSCPVSEGRHLCWNRDNCQKVCPAACGNRTCNAKGECCADQCLGDCFGDQCKVCKNFVVWRDGVASCDSKCPESEFMFMNRRCVSSDQCRNIPRPKGDEKRREKPYVPFNKTCSLGCPSDYEEVEDSAGQWNCKKCKGRCIKVCDSAMVNSIHTAQNMKDCTLINGSLEIQLRDGNNIVHELYDNLIQITEITGYLKITRSYPLISLGFLKNLLVIHGKKLDQKKFSLVVKDNSNLQELWEHTNETEHKIEIKAGRVQFHYNPKLCKDKIDNLVNMIGLKNVTEDEMQSNGDKVACNLADLKVSITVWSISAQLEWSDFKMEDDRYLLGYVVYWMKTDRTNISIYESRDACGGDGWNVDDVAKETPSDNYIYYPLTKLEPFTRYAFYVRTYTIASSPSGAQSQIYYFQTLPGVPSSVVNLTVVSNDSSILIVKWKPPAKPNGNIDRYIIVVEEKEATSADQRNYCEDGPDSTVKTPNYNIFDNNAKTTDELESEKNNRNSPTIGLKDQEQEAEAAASFEDALQNWVYVKRSPEKAVPRSKRELVPTNFTFDDTNENRFNVSTRTFKTKETFYVVRHLKHFREYTVKVTACRTLIEPSENDACACSSIQSIETKRTLAKPGADDVHGIELEPKTTNQSVGMVRVSWKEPREPNGVVQTYQIEYKRLNIENVRPTVVCITRKQFRDSGDVYDIKDLPAGNYSLRLRATSLGGEGSYSQYQYFYIPPASTATNLQVAVGIGISVLCILCIALGVVIFIRRNYSNVPNMKLIASVNPEYVSTAYVPDDWEVSRKKIELIRELGQGSFGMVYEGIAHDVVKGIQHQRCAVKTVNEHATDRERIEFLNEASVMKAFDTAHVVRLLGVVSQGQPTLVIMELMSNGDLKSYLRSHRPEEQELRRESPPSLKRVLQMAIEIADGMAYLTAKKFVHRDLAARNCMVSDNLTVKIGDFGMTRDIYETDYYRKGSKGLLPVRWMAPESLKDGVFQSSSDVWSYGVVLWEMATLASQPYQGLSNEQVLRYVIDGGVMERPENCPDKLYELMRLCWQHKSSARPTFLELATMLLPDASADFRQIAFYFTKAGHEALQAQATQVQDEAEATTPLRPLNADDDDGFSLDSGSDREDYNGDSISGRVSFPGSSFLTAAYHDKPEGGLSTAANGFASISDAATLAPITASSNSNAANDAVPTDSLSINTTEC